MNVHTIKRIDRMLRRVRTSNSEEQLIIGLYSTYIDNCLKWFVWMKQMATSIDFDVWSHYNIVNKKNYNENNIQILLISI